MATAHIGVADHLGWAVLVTVGGTGTGTGTGTDVIDRRRIELLAPGLPAAPIHHLGGTWQLHGTDDPPSDDELAAVVAEVRTSAAATIDAELEQLATDLDLTTAVLAVRSWPDDFPTDLATQRRVPHESRADPIMYRQELAGAARRRGWTDATYEARTIEAAAIAALAGRAGGNSDSGDGDPLAAPRRTLGAPWAKDHRLAYAAAIVAGSA